MENHLNQIVSYLLTQGWQIAILVIVIAAASWLLRNKSAHVRYLLWLIVLAKCLVPPLLTVPLPVLPDEQVMIVLPPTQPMAVEPVEVSVVEVPVPPVPPAPSAPVITNHEPRLTILQWLAIGWFMGASGFVLVAVAKALRTELWLKRERRVLPAGLQGEITELFSSLGVRIWPKLWLVEGIGQPFVWGLLHGGIYLPANFVEANNTEHRRGVIGHEVSHVLRFDAVINLLQVVGQAIFWFHPFVWWANKRIRAEREKCCDEMVIARWGAQVRDYSKVIVNILISEQESTRPVPSLAVAGSVKNIEERIRTMLAPGKKFHKRPSLVAATVALLIALVTVPTSLVLTARGQTQPTAQSVDKPAQSPAASAADNEKPEQPRYPARTFNSSLALYVSVQETSRSSPRRIGQTPGDPVQIPGCWIWWVGPATPVKDWDLLVREISQNKVPGLVLSSAADSDLQHLESLTGLQYLNLTETQITDSGLEHLKGLNRLQRLDLSGTKTTDAGLVHLKGLATLQDLDLDGTTITDAGLEYLKGLAALQYLGLGGTPITDGGLEHLKGLTGLQELDLSGTKTTDAGLVHLKGLSQLQTMHLGDTWITGAGLAHLKGMTKLKTLMLEGSNQITNAGLEHLKDLTGLQVLSLSKTNITGAGLAHLEGMTRLIDLELSDTLLTDRGLEHLKGLTTLPFLNLSGTKITDAGLVHLQGLTGLRWLWLENTQITDAGLEHLKTLTALKVLVLEGTQVTDAGVQRLKQSLPKLNVMR